MPPRAAPYRLGLIGLGWIVDQAYAPALLERRDTWAVTALCDPNTAARARLLRDWPDARACARFDEALAAPLDAVLIATPNIFHVEQSLAALRQGLACLCEKPAVASLADAAALAAAETDAARYMQATVCRYREDVQAWLAACRELGPLTRIEAQWLRHQGVPSASVWHLDARPGWTGVFPDLGYHLIDLIGAALDYPPDRLGSLAAACTSSGRAEAAAWYGEEAPREHAVADRFSLSGLLGGVEIELAVAWVDDTPGDVTRLTATGEKGSAILEGLFGYSTQRRVPHQRLTRLDRFGAPQDTRNFLPGPDLHRQAFGKLLDAFAHRLAIDVPSGQSDLMFVGAFIDDVRRACPEA